MSQTPSTLPSIDTLLANAVRAIQGVMETCLVQVNTGKPPSRETVQNLRDCVAMLTDLKKQEQAALDRASDADLEAIAEQD